MARTIPHGARFVESARFGARQALPLPHPTNGAANARLAESCPVRLPAPKRAFWDRRRYHARTEAHPWGIESPPIHSSLATRAAKLRVLRSQFLRQFLR